MSDSTRSDQGWLSDASRGGRAPSGFALSVAWSLSEPARVGEVAELPRGQASVLGRGGPQPDDGAPRLSLRRARPGARERGAPIASPGISRVQLRLSAADARGFEVESVGKAALHVDGVATRRARVTLGARLHIDRQLLLVVVRAPDELSARAAAPSFGFGEPDELGLVGESARAYALRDQLAFLARRAGHVFVRGPSGAGKELCARALHALSPRARAPFVSRNAATLPPGIIDAELFGNARNYPNAGLRERKGIVGEADGGTLFLDEVAELPEELQAHLLRLLDGGEYHRLGDETPRRADLRIIGATNRDEASMKHDLLARFTLRLDVPGLDERLEDVPLIARAILRRHARADDELRRRFFDGEHPRLDPGLVEALLARRYTTHVREVETMLLSSLAASRGVFLVAPEPAPTRPSPQPARPEGPPPSREQIEAELALCEGNVSQAWRRLGLSSRDALRRLMKKHEIAGRG
ncbi:MAG: sigma-54-dependent Fis family transcriptional regulator [Polyangiaceae bacterium]|nr:sigma-54-dependent Fis family transcriptional regulator [Polyangiaceae bacterium]